MPHAHTARACLPSKRRTEGRCCALWRDDPPRRPDPATYSQSEVEASGGEPTWNSPDLWTNHWSPWRLYDEIQVRVRNLSPDTSAVNAIVQLEVAPFGIGFDWEPLGGHVIGLAPGEERDLFYPLPEALRTGPPRISTRVRIQHASDTRTINNVGEQTIAGVFTSEAGRDLTFVFPVRNPAAETQELSLGALSNDVGAAVQLPGGAFGPHEQRNAVLTLQIPDSLHGDGDLRREITVVARNALNVRIGGATFIVRIDD